MIRHEFDVENYWKVIVYYNVDYSFFNSINKELLRAGFSKEPLDEMWYSFSEDDAKAVTCSNIKKHVSYVLFKYHPNKLDYINSVVHEAEHVKQAMLEAYDVRDAGEPPAYTIGYLVSKMYRGYLYNQSCMRVGN